MDIAGTIVNSKQHIYRLLVQRCNEPAAESLTQSTSKQQQQPNRDDIIHMTLSLILQMLDMYQRNKMRSGKQGYLELIQRYSDMVQKCIKYCALPRYYQRGEIVGLIAQILDALLNMQLRAAADSQSRHA